MHLRAPTRRGPFAPHPQRSGLGVVFVIVLALLVVLAVSIFGRSFFASFVADRTSKGAFGDLALHIAENALTEAHFRLARLANDPSGGTAFREFRTQEGPFSFTIPLADLPLLKAELADLGGFHLPEAGVTVSVLFQVPASRALPTSWDRMGSVRLSAEVAYDRLGVVRRLHETYDLRVSLTTTPRMFDLTTLFVTDAAFLVDCYAIDNDANNNIAASDARIRELADKNEEFIRTSEQILTELRSARSSATPLNSGAIDDAISSVEASRDILVAARPTFPTLTVAEFGTPTEGDPAAVHRFPDGPFAILSYDGAVDLPALNLPGRLQIRTAAIKAAETALKTAADAVASFLQGQPQDLSPLPGKIQTYATAAAAAVTEHAALLLEDYKGFQDAVVEVGGSAYEPLMAQAMGLDKYELAFRASALVDEAVHGDPGTALQTLLARCDTLGGDYGGFHGVLFVRNPTTPLVLDRTFSGRTVLVVEGDLTIRRALVADPTRDRLTIICFGTMDVQGPVQASLVPWISFRTAPGVTVTGNLVTSRLNYTAGTPDEVLAGRVIRGETMAAGPMAVDGAPAPVQPDAIHVTLGPDPVFVAIDRR